MASVIIATHNRCELLEFTLLSLYRQSVLPGEYEVIVVDDGSTDKTRALLATIKPPYRLRYFSNDTCRGAAYARNRGLKASRGEVIIFLDEMLVERDYIRKHLQYQTKPWRAVTTTFNALDIYTHCYPHFPYAQRLECKKLGEKLGLKHFQLTGKKFVRLFRAEQILNHSALSYGRKIDGLNSTFKNLQAAYGEHLERMAAPWFLLVTNSVSMTRDMLEKTGGFDERFKGGWLEDFELGYRLYQQGATFINADDISCYHQVHPVNPDWTPRLENYLYFCSKHPVAEVFLLAGMHYPFFRWNLFGWGKIVTQYYEIKALEKGRYKEWVEAFYQLSSDLCWNVAEFLKGSRLPWNTEKTGFNRWPIKLQKKIKQQLESLKDDAQGERYKELVDAFKWLICLPYKKLTFPL